MYRLINLYPWPDDPEEFKRYFVDVHLPLGANVPGAIRRGYAFAPDITINGDLDCFCVFEADYESKEALMAALATPEAAAAGADVPNYSPKPARSMLYELTEI
ncbi:EthD family reductase [Aurantiacibacter suaedae]|uniref:EthD family reductase n=1 Tax=Aurantiacibacter suaedae TaxID=2545755 RepID=UPI0010F4E506|nr:EthD family reductase [Aurantiacibacter suaedae]